MLIEEAYTTIKNNKETLYNYINDFFSKEKPLEDPIIKNINKYEEFLKNILAYHFHDLYPETFLCSYLTGDIYEVSNKILHKWYMQMIKGNFNDLLKNEKLTDYDIHVFGEGNRQIIYNGRYEFAKQLFDKTTVYFPKGDISIEDIVWFMVNHVNI